MHADPSMRVQQALDTQLPGTGIVTFDQSTHTAAEAAAAVGCPVGAIVKSLLFLVEDKPVLALVGGDRQVSDAKLAQQSGVSRKRVRMADAAAVRELTGYEVGGVPPVGHSRELPVLMDDGLARFAIVYAAAGTANAVFPTTPADLQRITGSTVAEIGR